MSRRFTREVQKPLGIVVQSKQEKPCGARPLRVEKGGRPNISPAFLFVGHPLWHLRARSPKDDVSGRIPGASPLSPKWTAREAGENPPANEHACCDNSDQGGSEQ